MNIKNSVQRIVKANAPSSELLESTLFLMREACLAEPEKHPHRKKRFLVVLFAVMCVLAGSVCAYAIWLAPEYPRGLPELDPNQVGYKIASAYMETSRDTSDASAANEETAQDTNDVPAAKAAAPAATKEEIYDRMLNSVDYFDAAEVYFDIIDSDGRSFSCQIETDLRTGQAYEAVTLLSFGEETFDGTVPDIESYADGSCVTEYYNTERFNTEKTYRVSHPVVTRRMREEELPADQPRAFIGTDDNIPNYIYRADSTNTAYGSSCLFPQGMTFGFLADFELWDITGHENYLDRDCLVLSGQTTGSYGRKTGASTFTMYVDSQTGILLKLSGLDEYGNVARAITVNSILIDGPATSSISQRDMEKYADYTELDY